MDCSENLCVHSHESSCNTNGLMKFKKKINKDSFKFGNMSVIVTHDHILPSQCHHPKIATNFQDNCQVCEFTRILKLPHLPDMIFPNNSVVITFPKEPHLRITFNALDALKSVDSSSYPNVLVAPSEEWQRTRKHFIHSRLGNRPFDWTYTSKYKGTVDGYTVLPTNETISMETLKRRDPINFYSQVTLYEDELADHGCSEMSVRLRAMPTCLFLLCRFYLRIDDVLVRICDTRLYKELNSDSFLRQWTHRELKLATSSSWVQNNVRYPDLIYSHLPIVHEEIVKLVPIRCST